MRETWEFLHFSANVGEMERKLVCVARVPTRMKVFLILAALCHQLLLFSCLSFFFCFRRRENINEKAIGIISIKRSPGAHILTDIDICCGVRTNRDKGSNIIASRLGLRYSCWCACVARDKLCCKTKLLYFVVFAAFNVVALSFSSAEWFLSCFKNIFPLI